MQTLIRVWLGLSQTQRYLVVFTVGLLVGLTKDYWLETSRLPCQPVLFKFDDQIKSAVLQEHRPAFVDPARADDRPKPPTMPQTSTSKAPSVVCSVLTMPQHWDSHIKAVEYTWAKHCDYRYYMYSKDNLTVYQGATVLNVPEGRDFLTAKTQALFRYAYGLHGNTVDWYMKADDDTFFIMENLRSLLARLDPNKPFYVGQMIRNKHGVPGPSIYASGGAGYLLSREATRLLIEKGRNITFCLQTGTYEDIDIGSCMYWLKATFIHGVDVRGRLSFHSWNPLSWFEPSDSHHRLLNYRDLYQYNRFERDEALSENAISFHYVTPGQMYVLDYFVHQFCLAGRGYCTEVKYPWEQKHGVKRTRKKR